MMRWCSSGVMARFFLYVGLGNRFRFSTGSGSHFRLPAKAPNYADFRGNQGWRRGSESNEIVTGTGLKILISEVILGPVLLGFKRFSSLSANYRFYPATRPPSASKASVKHVGFANRTVTMDLIGVIPH